MLTHAVDAVSFVLPIAYQGHRQLALISGLCASHNAACSISVGVLKGYTPKTQAGLEM